MSEQVKIAEFKAKLSKHLREVRAGREIIILDRTQPIAKLSPYPSQKPSLIIEPATDKSSFKDIKIKPLKKPIDSLRLLREDRDARDDFLFGLIRDRKKTHRRKQSTKKLG